MASIHFGTGDHHRRLKASGFGKFPFCRRTLCHSEEPGDESRPERSRKRDLLFVCVTTLRMESLGGFYHSCIVLL
jgi:hypothetical protein